MNIQYSNKARLFSLIIGAIGLVSLNQTQAACDYYKSILCPPKYTCKGSQWIIETELTRYAQRWSCGSGYLDPVYVKSYQCVYISNFNKPIIDQANCGPFEMKPQFTDKNGLTPVTCPPKPCVGPGEALEPPFWSRTGL